MRAEATKVLRNRRSQISNFMQVFISDFLRDVCKCSQVRDVN